MKAALKEIVTGCYSLYAGLRITLGQFFKRPVTLQYPHEALKMAPRYRGHIELIADPATGKPVCIACKVCEKACPSDCILVEGIKREGEKRKSVTEFALDFSKCSLCGSCVEACKSEAIQFSKEYNVATFSREEFLIDLVKRLETRRLAEAAQDAVAPCESPNGEATKAAVAPGGPPNGAGCKAEAAKAEMAKAE